MPWLLVSAEQGSKKRRNMLGNGDRRLHWHFSAHWEGENHRVFHFLLLRLRFASFSKSFSLLAIKTRRPSAYASLTFLISTTSLFSKRFWSRWKPKTKMSLTKWPGFYNTCSKRYTYSFHRSAFTTIPLGSFICWSDACWIQPILCKRRRRRARHSSCSSLAREARFPRCPTEDHFEENRTHVS